MEKSIGIGLIMGLVIATSLYVYNSEQFSKTQKIFLLACLIFPPLQWIMILIFLLLNHNKHKNSPENKNLRKILKENDEYDDKINSLKELETKGILTEEEHNTKIQILQNSKLESELKITKDYILLKTLFEDGILTKEEFEKKVAILKIKLNENSDIDFQKVREGKIISLGKFIEYKVIINKNEIFDNVYKRLSNGLFFIYKNDKIQYFNSTHDLIKFLKD